MSDLAETDPSSGAPPSGVASPSPLSQPSSAIDEARKKRVQSATVFLKNPRVQGAPISRRVNFLKSKGLSPEEISEAFSAIGQPQSVDEIKKLINTAPSVTAAPPAAPTAAPSVPNQGAIQQQYPQPQFQQQPQYPPPQPPPGYPQGAPMQQYPYGPAPLPGNPYPAPVLAPNPQMPLPLPPTAAKAGTAAGGVASWHWKDYFIAGTVAAAVSYGVAKVASHVLPFEIVRKGNSDPQSHQQPQSTSSATKTVSQEKPKLPEPPQIVEKENAELKAAQSQIQTLEAKVTELEGKLETERKEKAELNSLKAKQSGQILQLNRTNEKSAAELRKVTAELTAVKEELDALKSKGEDKLQGSASVGDQAIPTEPSAPASAATTAPPNAPEEAPEKASS